MFSNIGNISIEITDTLSTVDKINNNRIFLTSGTKTPFQAIVLCLGFLTPIMKKQNKTKHMN